MVNGKCGVESFKARFSAIRHQALTFIHLLTRANHSPHPDENHLPFTIYDLPFTRHENPTGRSPWIVHTLSTKQAANYPRIPPTAVGGSFIPCLPNRQRIIHESHRPQSVDRSYTAYIP